MKDPLAQLAGRLGHDLRGPLINLKLSLQMLQDEEDPGEREELLERMGLELARADRLVQGLLEFSRSQAAPQRQTVRLQAVIAQVASDGEGEVELDLADAAPLSLDPDQHLVLMRHLLRNAREAAGPGGRVRVTLRRNGHLEARVEDSGPGIEADLREQVFLPLAGPRKGSGLGLATCRRIVEAHQGEIRVESSELGGAALVVRYPCEGA